MRTRMGCRSTITNCSNNYGPYQFPEKLIPLMIINALTGKPLPVYGDGLNVRDWLHVEDHCAALACVLDRGRLGETYNVGGGNEMTNLDLVNLLCEAIDRKFADRHGSLAERFPDCPAARGARVPIAHRFRQGSPRARPPLRHLRRQACPTNSAFARRPRSPTG